VRVTSSAQDVDALRAMPALDDAMRAAGVEPTDDYTIPAGGIIRRTTAGPETR
jgi:hypothetical protein